MMRRGTFVWIYGWPIALFVLGLAGVGAALFADGWWDWVSWAALAGIGFTAVCCSLRGSRQPRPALPSRTAGAPEDSLEG